MPSAVNHPQELSPERGAPGSRVRVLFVAAPLLVAGITLLVFFSSVGYGFVDWDDPVEVASNPHIESLSPSGIKWMFTNYDWVRRYQPLDWVSWAINYRLDGRNPFGYHVGNVVQHVLGAVLLYFLILKLLRRWREQREGSGGGEPRVVPEDVLVICSVMGALAWAIHPLRAESVVWVTGRIYTQCALFLIACFLCYVYSTDRGLSRGRRGWLYVISIVLFLCSLLSYAVVVGAAAALLLIDVYPLCRFPGSGWQRWWNGRARRIYLEKVPFLAAALIIGIVTIVARVSAHGMWEPPPTLQQFSLFSRIMQAFYSWAYYAWVPFEPVGLLPVYTRLAHMGGMAFNPNDAVFYCSAAFVIVVTGLAVVFRKRYPWLAVAWGFHMLMLVPYLGLTESPHYTNDRYAHMQELAMGALIAGGLALFFVKFGMRAFRGVVVAFAGVLAGLGFMCYDQGTMWKESETFFTTIIRELGDDPYRADIYWRLGAYEAEQGRDNEALVFYDKTLAMDPRQVTVLQLKSRSLLQLAAKAQASGAPQAEIRGRFIEAGETLDKISDLYPNVQSLMLAAAAYEQAHQLAAALNRCQLAANVEPGNYQIRLQIARLFYQTGKAEEAFAALDAAIGLYPELRGARDQIIASWMQGGGRGVMPAGGSPATRGGP